MHDAQARTSLSKYNRKGGSVKANVKILVVTSLGIKEKEEEEEEGCDGARVFV